MEFLGIILTSYKASDSSNGIFITGFSCFSAVTLTLPKAPYPINTYSYALSLQRN